MTLELQPASGNGLSILHIDLSQFDLDSVRTEIKAQLTASVDPVMASRFDTRHGVGGDLTLHDDTRIGFVKE